MWAFGSEYLPWFLVEDVCLGFLGQGVCLGSWVMMLAPVCWPECLHWVLGSRCLPWFMGQDISLLFRLNFRFSIGARCVHWFFWSESLLWILGQDVYFGFWVRIFTLVLELGCLHVCVYFDMDMTVNHRRRRHCYTHA